MSDYLWFEGTPFPIIGYEKKIIQEARDEFVIRDEDTVILTYPKSGTNWLIEMVCLIQTKGNPKWVQSVPIWERSPWLETDVGYQILIKKEGPRLISSHLPFHFFAKSFFSSKAKVIYVIRNPRDILVSGYFFWCKTNLVKNPESLRTYFEWFLKGNVAYGSWFEHTRAWLSMRERDNFLLLSYEDMKKDTKSTILKICDFLGTKLEPDEQDMVLKYSSFQAMKENNMSNFSIIPEDVITNGLVLLRKVFFFFKSTSIIIVLGNITKTNFSSFAKREQSYYHPHSFMNAFNNSILSTTGDWKNHFTVAQAEAFDKVFQENMAGFPTGLFPWE